MAIFYPFSDQIPLWQVLGASLLIILISAAIIIMAKRLPYLFTGWMWFSITIAPVIGIIQISITTPYAMADRYHYLPSIGLAMMMAWGIPTLTKREEIRKKLLFPAGIIFLAIISFLSWNQCGCWKDSIILFSHALKVTDYNWLAYNNLGVAYNDLGNYRQAIEDYDKAIEIKPGFAMAYYNRGIAFKRLGDYKQAIKNYDRAIEIKPGYAEAYNNRGSSYNGLGNYRQAIEDLNRAIEIKPGYAEAYNNRSKAYNGLGNYGQAIEDLNRAIEIKPGYADAYYNRAIVYLKQGDNISGCSDAQKACELGDCKVLEVAKDKGYCR
jgi:tetratricopeptide (TPR) repeat protein